MTKRQIPESSARAIVDVLHKGKVRHVNPDGTIIVGAWWEIPNQHLGVEIIDGRGQLSTVRLAVVSVAAGVERA